MSAGLKNFRASASVYFASTSNFWASVRTMYT